MVGTQVTRRRFTALTSIVVGGLLVAGCTEPEEPVEPEEEPGNDDPPY